MLLQVAFDADTTIVIAVLLIVLPLVLGGLTFVIGRRIDDDDADVWAIGVGVLTFMAIIPGFLALGLYLYLRFVSDFEFTFDDAGG